MKTIGIGIIGTGSIASGGHAPAVLAANNLKLVSVLSRSVERGREFVIQHASSDVAVHINIDSFVQDTSMDVAIVCLPDGLHVECAARCIESGKHVLIEKPMATSIDDCKHLIELAAKNNVILATGFHLRHHAGHRSLLTRIARDNALGNIRHIRAIWAWPQKDNSNWRAKRELAKWWSLSAVGTHCFDMVRWFASDFNEWLSLKSVTSNRVWGGPHDESAIIAGILPSGITVEIACSVQFGPYNRLEIFGSDGEAICHNTFGRAGSGEIWLNGESLQFSTVNPFYAQIQNVIHCIQNKDIPIADGFAGLRNVQDLFLVMESTP